MSNLFPSGWWVPLAIGCVLFFAAFGGVCFAIAYWLWGVK